MARATAWATLAVCSLLGASHAGAGAFWPGEVRNLPDGETLTIRDAPSPKARELGTVETGTALSLTGLCRDSKNGRTFSIPDDMAAMADQPRDAALKQVAKRMAAPNIWCNIASVGDQPGSIMMIDGWARGSFIWPD